jgi:3-oxoacyl-[acyl-carrier protein] reductase
MDLSIKGRVALVTGASQGLGLAAAEALAAEGVNLVLAARNADRLASAAFSVAEKFGVRVAHLATDVTQPQEVEALVSFAITQFGQIDICIANAGGPQPKLFADTLNSEWIDAFELNVMSIINLARLTLPGMRELGWGRFVAISSITAKQPMQQMILSNAIRPSVGGLVKTLSNEYGGINLTVNNICPGFFATPRLLKLQETESKTRADINSPLPHIAVGRVGQPHEFGATVAFLCSESAGYINGISLMIDGGYSKAW